VVEIVEVNMKLALPALQELLTVDHSTTTVPGAELLADRSRPCEHGKDIDG
jgi:hypothetical protein